jgi:hypothetical protein
VGVEDTHVASGAKGVTSLEGTVALGFLPDGENSVRVARTGYQPIELPATISPADDRPITLLLRRAKQRDPVSIGETHTDEVEEAGTEPYQCCVHPWMRTTVPARGT